MRPFRLVYVQVIEEVRSNSESNADSDNFAARFQSTCVTY